MMTQQTQVHIWRKRECNPAAIRSVKINGRFSEPTDLCGSVPNPWLHPAQVCQRAGRHVIAGMLISAVSLDATAERRAAAYI